MKKLSFIDCGNPPTPANGTITLTNTSVTTPGATATQTCNTGYNLSGTADISCGTDGSWSDPPATCALIGMDFVPLGFRMKNVYVCVYTSNQSFRTLVCSI